MELIDLSNKVQVQSSFSSIENLVSSKTRDILENFPVLDVNSITYEDFYTNFMISNKPCMFTKSATSNWASMRDWVIPGEGKINYDFLREMYGDASVSVTKIKDQMSMEYGGMNCDDMKFNDYLDYWMKYANSNLKSSMPCLYLKDWHIVKDSMKVGYEAYKTPKFFQSDWMNEIWEDKNDDFRFAYMGPKGSWTPFHSDVYGSFSWSANIIGQKKWRLYPPGKESKFRQPNGQIKYDYENPGVEKQDYVDIIQNSGEIIFVPSGWHHIVWNELDTISINHNWMNASNIIHVWNELKNALKDVKSELQDLNSMEGFSEQCQLILKANHGMDYSMFIEIINKIASHRSDPEDCKARGLSKGHASFDLKVIHHIIEEHLNRDDFIREHWSHMLDNVLKMCIKMD